MGFLDKVKQTITDNLPDVVTNPQISGQSKEMLYKYDKVTILKGSRLIVNPSQEALFVQNGRIDAVFGPGSYNLETDNIPLAQQLLSLAYGGDSPNRAEIWFVNKAVAMDISWGTPTPLTMEERKFGVPLTIKVRCNGSINLKISDSKLLFTEMAGQGNIFTIENFKESMRGMMISRLQKTLGEYMMTNNTSFVTLQQGITIIEQPLQALMQTGLNPYGLSIEGCYVKGFTVVEDDSWERYKRYEDEYFKIHVDATRVERLAQADAVRVERLGEAEAHRLESLGTNYQAERQLDILNTAAGNEGMSPLGNPMTLGLGLAAGQTIGSEIMPNSLFASGVLPTTLQTPTAAPAPTPKPAPAPKAEPQVSTCANCQATFPVGAKFCPECGQPTKKTYKCTGCGLASETPMKFCPECGSSIS